jgi:hypothetical protein
MAYTSLNVGVLQGPCADGPAAELYRIHFARRSAGAPLITFRLTAKTVKMSRAWEVILSTGSKNIYD